MSRRRAGDGVDARVGLSQIRPLGTRVVAGDPLLRLHAADRAQAEATVQAVLAAITVADAAPVIGPALIDTLPGALT